MLKPNRQSTPSSSSKSQTNQSASAKSVSEDISGEKVSTHVSPNTTGSSFPSYGTPKSEDGNQEQPSTSARGQQEPETSTILNMLRYVWCRILSLGWLCRFHTSHIARSCADYCVLALLYVKIVLCSFAVVFIQLLSNVRFIILLGVLVTR